MNDNRPAATELEFRVELKREIEAPMERVFAALLEQLGPRSQTPEGQPLEMKLEAFPGGRWYRDLGEGNGHHWAHVQAIRAPELLELTGPLFMSQPVCNNVQYRLSFENGTTTLVLVHSAFGLVPEEAREGMPHGWAAQIDLIAASLA